MPNAPAQARRTNDVGLSTETRSRRCLEPGGSLISVHVPCDNSKRIPPQDEYGGNHAKDGQSGHEEQTPPPCLITICVMKQPKDCDSEGGQADYQQKKCDGIRNLNPGSDGLRVVQRRSRPVAQGYPARQPCGEKGEQQRCRVGQNVCSKRFHTLSERKSSRTAG
jgi:hypothetical protein